MRSGRDDQVVDPDTNASPEKFVLAGQVKRSDLVETSALPTTTMVNVLIRWNLQLSARFGPCRSNSKRSATFELSSPDAPGPCIFVPDGAA